MTETSNLLVTTSTTNASLVDQAKESLGPDFQLIDAGRYVAIFHQSYGAAALYPGPDEALATKCADALGKQLKFAGLNMTAIPFALSDETLKPPVVIRSGPRMATDILVGMSRASINMTPLNSEEFSRAVATIALSSGEKKRIKPLDPAMMTMLKQAIHRIVGRSKMFAGGPEVDLDDLLMPEFLLPALLYSAAEHWTIPVASQKGRGGFVMEMAYDDSAVLMFKVTGLDVSSPVLFFLPVLDVIRRSKRGGEFILDDCIERFGNFITENLSSHLETSLEVRIATSS